MLFLKNCGKSPIKSTDMGVNMAGKCIIDEEAVCRASEQEIIRRYYSTRYAIARVLPTGRGGRLSY